MQYAINIAAPATCFHIFGIFLSFIWFTPSTNAPLPQNAGRKPKLNDRQMARLKRLVAKRPDATLQELKKGLRVTMSDDAMIRALGVLGLPLKKTTVAKLT